MAQTHFFATPGDIAVLLAAVEGHGAPLRYALAGALRSTELILFLHGKDIPRLGIADATTGDACASFLVVEPPGTVRVRSIPMDSGGERYCVDQLVNPDAVLLTPAGVRDDEFVLRGRVATASTSPQATAVLRRFRSALRANFSSIRGAYVGPEALSGLDGGKRLAISTKTPKELDLKR